MIRAGLARMFATAIALDWRGHDPYDLLASPLLTPIAGASWLAARVLMQSGRRLGSRPRDLLRVPAHEEAKALADFLSAASLLAALGEGWAAEHIEPLRCRLLARAVRAPHGAGWGLEFPYASRFLHVPARAPNVYTTLCAAQALLDADAVAPSDETTAAIVRAVGFIVGDAGFVEDGDGVWFRYYPGYDGRIVNIQALAAGLLARVGTLSADDDLRDLADRTARTIVRTQRAGGSWRYSEDGRAQFVDGFHTGFVLQGLAAYRRYRGEAGIAGIDGVLDGGTRFFRRHLLTASGLPRYYADGPPTRDGQAVAGAVDTLAACGGEAGDVEAALRAWRLLTVSRPRTDRGWLGQDYVSLRWNLGPAALAGARLLARIEQGQRRERG